MRFAREHLWQLSACAGFDRYVAASVALRMRLFAGVVLKSDRDFGIGFNVPHDVEEITGILGPEFQANLPPHFSGGQRFCACARPHIAKADLRGLGSRDADHCARTRCLYGEPSVGPCRDDAIGHTELLLLNALPRWPRGRGL